MILMMEIMMINIFIDPTILAFPPREKDEEKDSANIREFYEDICLIYEYIENPNKRPDIAFFKEDKLKQRLTGFEYCSGSEDDFDDQKGRIKNAYAYKKGSRRDPRDVERRLFKIFNSFYGYGDEKRNIKVIEFKMKDIEEMDKKDKSENTVNSHYLQLSFFRDEHEKLSRYASEIHKKYDLKEWKICARDDYFSGMEKESIGVKQFKDYYKNPVKHFDSLESAFVKAKDEFSSELIFSEDILTHPDSIFSNLVYDKDFVPDRLFYYLEALASAVKHINTMNDMPSIEVLNDIVKVFGCDLTPDLYRYREHKCYYRHWKINGKLNQLGLYLRPLTNVETGENRLTMRVYYKWNRDQKKMAVMILEKPPNCEECDKELKCYPLTDPELNIVKSDLTDDISDIKGKIARNGAI
jgi:hypothetical protein